MEDKDEERRDEKWHSFSGFALWLLFGIVLIVLCPLLLRTRLFLFIFCFEL